VSRWRRTGGWANIGAFRGQIGGKKSQIKVSNSDFFSLLDSRSNFRGAITMAKAYESLQHEFFSSLCGKVMRFFLMFSCGNNGIQGRSPLVVVVGLVNAEQHSAR
jgi:hypothetical protein